MHLQSSLNCVETDKLHVCSPACSQKLRKRREDRREKWEDGEWGGKVGEPKETSAETRVKNKRKQDGTRGWRWWVCMQTDETKHQQHQQRTLLQMSPVALESEADMILLLALSPPPLHRKAGRFSRQQRGYRGERGRQAHPKCFTADVAALPQQPFPIQNWCPDCSIGVYTPAYWYSTAGLFSLEPALMYEKKLFSGFMYLPLSSLNIHSASNLSSKC